MRLGARSLKTGMAVTIALTIAVFFNLVPPIMAGVAAAVTTQPSVRRSFRAMIQNIYGNLIGAAIAILFVVSFGDNPIVVGLAVVIVIAIHLKFRLYDTLTLSMVTVIFVMSSGETNTGLFILAAMKRFVLVCIGVGSATLVNTLLLPPKYEDHLYESILNQTTELFKWIRLLGEGASDNTKIKSERSAFDVKKLKIENYYHWYREERVYSRKLRYVKLRRVVIFKEMITATGLLHRILDELDRNENAYRLLPPDFTKTLKEQLYALIAYHERVLLKFDGKVRQKRHEEQTKKDNGYKMALAAAFTAHFEVIGTEDWLDLFPLIASIIDYSRHIEHLDMLVDSFQTYHKKENRIKFSQEWVE
ncbi:FUSC family protein [Sporolactobacillus pectinivorans]|uniref:FUSC family protein n=1 Tax=Sporolactobacillus pectinivorans TaxID=1591408 RepID=UPI000C26BE47|nr:aromatic acid exporter family protein [Sporolactobacillus pectinivorans]